MKCCSNESDPLILQCGIRHEAHATFNIPFASLIRKSVTIMKRIRLFAFILTVLLAGACESFATLELDRDTLEFRSDASSITFRIKTTGKWSIYPDPLTEKRFYSLSADSGVGDAEVTVRVDNNSTIYHRTQDFIIKGTGESKRFSIVQVAPMPGVADIENYIVDPDVDGHIPGSGGTVIIAGFHSGMPSFRCDQTDVIIEGHTKNTIMHHYKATVPSCPTAEGRTIGFFLTLTTESGEVTLPYYFEQSGTGKND